MAIPREELGKEKNNTVLPNEYCPHGHLNDRYFIFRLFAFTLFLGLVVPLLVQDGMFTDGLLYTCVAKNLSEGYGTFWYPYFSHSLHPDFHEQPPLTFGIEAIFFLLLGKSIYVERFYSFCTGISALFLIMALWKEAFQDSMLRKMSWWPVILWIIIPVCFWSYANNMEENTMTIFSLLSTFYILRGLRTSSLLHFLAAGIMLSLAALSKGFPGLFPVCTAFFYWLYKRKITWNQMLKSSAATFIVLVCFFLCLFADPQVRESLHRYLFNRVLNSIANVSNRSSRFYILYKLAAELLPSILLSLGLWGWFSRLDRFINDEEGRSNALLFISLGIAGSLPLMVTMEQRGFYLVTALPFYAIGLASLTAASLQKWIDSISLQRIRTFKFITLTLLLIGLGLSVLSIGRTKRDQQMLHDVYVIGPRLPVRTTISIPPELYDDWSLHQYFMRHYGLTLDPHPHHPYYLCLKGTNLPEGYRRLQLATKKYDLCVFLQHPELVLRQ